MILYLLVIGKSAAKQRKQAVDLKKESDKELYIKDQLDLQCVQGEKELCKVQVVDAGAQEEAKTHANHVPHTVDTTRKPTDATKNQAKVANIVS